MSCIFNKKPSDRHCEYCSAVYDERLPKNYDVYSTNNYNQTRGAE